MRPVAFLALALSSILAVSLNTHWDENDTKRLSDVLKDVLQNKKSNIASLHYAASGLKLLNVPPSKATAQAACEIAQRADFTKLDVLYHASALAGDLPDCPLGNIGGAQKTIEDVVTANPNGERIAQALRSANRLNIKVDKVAFDKLLTTAMKDDSPANLAWIFDAASLLDMGLAAKYLEKVKVLLSQADEVDKRFLQFDGGLSTTANAIHSILSLTELQGKISALSKDQVLLFTNYLLSRKHVSTEKSAFHLLRALGALVNNHHFVPVTVSLQGPVMVDRTKPIVVNVCNVFGLPVATSNVRADITLEGSTTASIANIRLSPVKNSEKAFIFGPDKLPNTPGFYSVAIKVESEDKRLVGLTDSKILFKLCADATVNDFKVGAIDKDEVVTGASLSSVALFSKHGKVIAADLSKRIYISFSVKDKATGSLMQPHQAFVLFKHVDGAEVFYTADVQSGGRYLLDIALAKAYKDFEGVSGKYVAYLIIGDATIKTPISWPFAEFTLTIPPATPEIVPKSQRINYDVLPEIRHLFRQPEKRPLVIVSDAFTLICLAPLFLLIVLWFRIGPNFGNMPVSLWTLLLHAGLAALFALYFMFWIEMNMFETLKYLALIGSFTYLAGNRVLKSIANKRKSKAE